MLPRRWVVIEMQDPSPENIMGQKRHTLNWEINVAHTVAAVLGLYVAWKLFGGLSSSSSDEDDLAGDVQKQIGDISEAAAPIVVE